MTQDSRKGFEDNQSGEANSQRLTLTESQREIIKLVAEGKSRNEIAETCFKDPRTVAIHFRAIFEKLGVDNRTDAVAKVKEQGLLDGPDHDEAIND